MKHRFDSFEHEMNANASKVAVVNQLARQLLQVEHPNAAEVIEKQNELNDRLVYIQLNEIYFQSYANQKFLDEFYRADNLKKDNYTIYHKK